MVRAIREAQIDYYNSLHAQVVFYSLWLCELSSNSFCLKEDFHFPEMFSNILAENVFVEEGMATHSSILAWTIPQTEESGGLQFMASQELDTTWWLNQPQPFNSLFQCLLLSFPCLSQDQHLEKAGSVSSSFLSSSSPLAL